MRAYKLHETGDILAASPLELIEMLYREAVVRIGEARRWLASNQIRKRSGAITAATEILAELVAAVDRERGGDMARNLLLLYDHVLRLLAQANISQKDEPLAQAERLLRTLSGAWTELARREKESPTRDTPSSSMNRVYLSA